MRRVWLVWLLFAFCLALSAAAMARLGATARALEASEAAVRRQARLEENLQLALWRMDSALAPLVAEESARPYFAYSAFYPTERAYTSMFAEIQKGDVLVPSPLLTYTAPQVRVHFQFGPDGRLTSPQVPTGNMRDLAESGYVSGERIEQSTRRLGELQRSLSLQALAAALPADEPTRYAANEQWVLAPFGAEMNQEYAPQTRGSYEYQMRTRNAQLAQKMPAPARSTDVSQGPLQGIWVGRTLVLARRVRVNGALFLQGCWLDWDAIRAELLAGVTDLLPQPSLEPVSADDKAMPTRMLAALPARLVPGPLPAWASESRSPVALSLWIAWGALAIAALAVALLLQGAIALSERRGTFVSAVTHELRTPLTTFRLYTEMLSEGVIPDETARRSYLATLRAEADRLGRLVENVLSFSRLERGRATDRRETVSLCELLDRVVPDLASQARQAEMELTLEKPVPEARLQTDVSVVEQILSNLVDNAAKYARTSPDRRIHLEVSTASTKLSLAVRDHGPGLSRQAERRLFRPFSKSAVEAAHSAPGVGLGLALCRRLAAALGGDLRLQRNGNDGATFVLTLPRAT